MINNIRIFPRYSVKKLISTEATWGLKHPWILISIYSDTTGPLITGDCDLEALTKKGCIDVKTFEFHDVTQKKYIVLKKSYPRAKKQLKLFTENQAKDILEYIDQYKNDSRDIMLVIHCEAGVSRSGAVGLFACRYLGIDVARFRALHPTINPNPHVYDTLCAVSKMNSSHVLTAL